jgi:glutamate-ammonia-ligase adenylyltransferase
MLHVSTAYPNPDAVLTRLIKVVEAIGRRISYLALLLENPRALEHLARLCSASSLVAERVARSPLLLDELLDSRIFTEAPTRESMTEELEQMLEGIGIDDLERRMDTLRAFQQAAVLRIAVADITGMLPLMKVSDRLTELAEIVLASALDTAWNHMVTKHGRPWCGSPDTRRECGFAIVGYGKLGGLELAYGSDLDLVFLNDSDGEQAETDGEQPLDNAVFFARLGQRIVHLLATPTAVGVLYEVDTRLRPSGTSGLLVSSVASFEAYQRDEAWTWEHQALLRARPVAGSPGIGDAFVRIRRSILGGERDPAKLREEVSAMRARMRDELATREQGMFDLKQGAGGIADIEFLVQYLVLANAHANPALLDWTDNIRQLESLVTADVLEAATGEALTEAYKTLRERTHRLGLQGEPALVPDTEFTAERVLVTDLWNRYLV